MLLNSPRCYNFNTASQWHAGVVERLEFSDTGLKSASSITVQFIPGSSAADNTGAIGVDPCGALYWVREQSFELLRALPEGVQEAGRLNINPEQWRAAKLSVGAQRLWLLVRSVKEGAETRIYRHFTDTLQRLARIEIDRYILDLAGDGEEGAWLLLGKDSEAAEVRRLDQSGNVRERFILPDVVIRGQLVTDNKHNSLFVLDSEPQTDACKESLAWRLWRIDACSGEICLVFALPRRDPVCNRDVPDFRPDLMALGQDGRIHLLSNHDGAFWSLDQGGRILAQLPATVPAYWLPINAFIATRRWLISGAAGIGELRDTGAAPTTTPESTPTYISPVLVSPEGAQQGWMRADLDVDFSRGSAIEISIASTRDTALVEEISGLFANAKLSSMVRLSRLDSLLPWMEERTVIYQGGDWPAGRPLRFPLQEIEDTHLWLRICITTNAGAQPPKLNTMRVYYPNISYTRYLPAVYQESKQAAGVLRRLLSIYESLFGDLDAQLANLPTRIDPQTAPDDWLPYLLSWLGLPAPTELDPEEQRVLLKAAPGLLRERGTKSALEKLLGVLVGEDDDFTVEDNSDGPTPWTLPASDRGSYGARLGCNTLVLAQKQPGFYLEQSACLGSQALGYSTLDPLPLFAKTSGLITIKVATSAAGRERLEPLLQRYLPYFIPAHSRYTLRFVTSGDLHGNWLLDAKFRLQGEPSPRLSEAARLGRLRLKSENGAGINLGRSALSDDGPYLT